ncbi:MAG: N-acetylmuramoyl-L-alanine amidase [Elusimicrobia bacterium]|nr:N-acetylmuramoyl-L-alanine amidase [Elusimicrobiota bacterium]
MKKIIKHLLYTLVGFACLITAFSEALASQVKIPISVIQDSADQGSIELLLIEKMGYLKARDVAEIFSAELSFENDFKKFCFKWADGKNAIFRLEDEYTEIEGIKRKMMKTPLMINDKHYLPLEVVITRAFQSASGSNVRWSFPDRTLWISYKGNITDIRNYTYDNYSRFVIELSGPLDYSFTESPGQFSILIPKGRLISPHLSEGVSDPLIKSFNLEQTSGGMKFKLELSENAGKTEVMKLPSPPRIVMDIENTAYTSTDSVESLPDPPAGPILRGKDGDRDIQLIVIDPGHGGQDPGAIGNRGVLEKDVVLGISQKLSRKIRERLKIRSVLTRTGDYFLPLSERTKIANERGADLFISVHANASMSPDSHGFEVYFLAEEASDREAAAVAKLENSVLAMEDEPHPDDRVSSILWSLTLNQFMNESSELCAFVNSSVVKKTGLACRGVKQAGFHVLRGARMPAILLEVGFISNRREEALLVSEDFQEKVADSICDALEEYIKWVGKK